MLARVNEFLTHPHPGAPQPQPPQPRVQPPTVYVYEPQRWEYRIVDSNQRERVAEDQLNALGNDGWELVGIVPGPKAAQFVFKRPRA
jgi:hypothetical protein